MEPIAQKGRSAGTNVEVEIPPDLPVVDVDPVHAGQVIDNLMTNALQAVGRSGTIRVNARHVNGVVSVEVSDNGPGIARENEHRIFEPLFTTKDHGIGLGLALCKSLAQANGGDLTLASRPGEGARFVLTLATSGEMVEA